MHQHYVTELFKKTTMFENKSINMDAYFTKWFIA